MLLHPCFHSCFVVRLNMMTECGNFLEPRPHADMSRPKLPDSWCQEIPHVSVASLHAVVFGHTDPTADITWKAVTEARPPRSPWLHVRLWGIRIMALPSFGDFFTPGVPDSWRSVHFGRLYLYGLGAAIARPAITEPAKPQTRRLSNQRRWLGIRPCCQSPGRSSTTPVQINPTRLR